MTNKIQTYTPCREQASDVCQWSSKRIIFVIQKHYNIFSTVSGFRTEHFRWNYDEFRGSQCTFSRQNFAKPFLLRYFHTMQVLLIPPLWITWSYQWKKTRRLWTFKHLLVSKAGVALNRSPSYVAARNCLDRSCDINGLIKAGVARSDVQKCKLCIRFRMSGARSFLARPDMTCSRAGHRHFWCYVCREDMSGAQDIRVARVWPKLWKEFDVLCVYVARATPA